MTQTLREVFEEDRALFPSKTASPDAFASLKAVGKAYENAAEERRSAKTAAAEAERKLAQLQAQLSQVASQQARADAAEMETRRLAQVNTQDTAALAARGKELDAALSDVAGLEKQRSELESKDWWVCGGLLVPKLGEQGRQSERETERASKAAKERGEKLQQTQVSYVDDPMKKS
ncbi:hypothetical protein T484DRAFT_1771359 [Baffinella frigidus]|nr:hypothetical protein T484DRAFT_1771359 [Cryptophyta sp. CCMP2293]